MPIINLAIGTSKTSEFVKYQFQNLVIEFQLVYLGKA